MRQKIDVYRRISRLQDIQSIETIRQELRDRFGEVPASVERLLRLAELRMDATLWTVRSVDIQERFLRLQYSDGKRIAHLSKLHGGKLRIVESEQSAYWPLWEVLTARTDSRMDPRMDVRRDASMGSRMGSRMDQRSNQGGSVRPKEELSDKERLARIDLLAVLKEVLRY
jgi:transcription-repair coupling factor (superfamily II helicase)